MRLSILYVKGSKVRISKLLIISVPEECLISANSADLAEMPHYGSTMFAKVSIFAYSV